MMRVAWRLAAITLLVLTGLLVLLLGYAWLPLSWRTAIRKTWSRLLLRLCGLSLQVTPDSSRWGHSFPMLVVMNHVSWLDIFILNAVMPATFIAKSEIRRWPLVGWLVAGAGTLFVERGSRHAVRHVNRAIAHRFARGEHVAFFPEGTTTDGQTLLPFKTSLFACAMHEDGISELRHVVQPIAIRYRQNGRPSLIPAYIGDQTLVHSVAQILSARGLSAQLHILAPIHDMPESFTRHQLAARAEQAIAEVIRCS